MNCSLLISFTRVNSIIPNKFPSTEGDHPRLVIPFFDEYKSFEMKQIIDRVDKSKHIQCRSAGSTNFAKDIPKENTTIVFVEERRYKRYDTIW